MYKVVSLICCVCFICARTTAQTYSPVPVTGFTQDVFAEAGTNSQAVTTTNIDGTNHIMYTTDFATTNGLANGVLNSGTIASGTRTYQLAPYAGNNALYLSMNGAVANSSAGNTLTLQTPGRYSAISLLGFSTEGSSTVSISQNFTDGTTSTLGTNTFSDWFGGAGVVYSGFGRIARLASSPYVVDGPPTNPRWYTVDFQISCANQNKLLQSITINFVAQGGTSGRAIVLAISGSPYTPFATAAAITPAICGANNGSITLTAMGGTAPLSYVWNTTPPQFASTATGLAAGTYTATIADANGCTTSYTGTVNQTAAITAAVTANPTSICSGDSAILAATATGTNNTFTWSPGGQTGPIIKVGPVDTTVYTVTIANSNGCSTTATTTVAVRKLPVASFTATPQRICIHSTDTARFTGTAGSTASYNWNFGTASVVSGTGAGPYVLQFSTPGSQLIKLTVTENGCSSSEATQTVLVDGASQPAFTISPATICSGDTVLVSFTGTAFTGSIPAWNWGGGTVISGSGTGPYTVKYANSGTISLSISNNTCADTATAKTVVVTPLPVAAFTYGMLRCTPVNIPFTNNSQNGVSYFWDFGDGSTSTDQQPLPHFYTAAGIYSTLLTATNGSCSATYSQIIRLYDFPVAGFTSNPDVTATPVQLSQSQFSFTSTSTRATSYLWDFGDGTTSTQANPVHHYTIPGTFTVRLNVSTDSLACFDSTSVSPYIIIADSSLRIPNAFSPNNDGINDRWQIPGLLGYPDCRVEIFDRYGQIVFTSKGYTNPWDGKRNGTEVPVGTYYYVIRTGLKNYTGWVFLVR